MHDTPAKTDPDARASVRLILCDIDGCLNSGFSTPLDLPALTRIADRISQLRSRGIVTTLCTGRPAPYAQAIAQALGITATMVVENGAALFDPLSGQCTTLASPSEKAALDSFGTTLIAHPDWSRRLTREIGKQSCLSLNGPEISDRSPAEIRALMGQLKALTGADQFDWSHSSTAIDITPKGISKASGAERLLDAVDLTWGHVAAIGDSTNDVPVLKRAATSLCPANADAETKKGATFISSNRYAEGVNELLGFIEKGMQNV